MIKLKRPFQKKIFNQLIKKYGGSIKTEKILNIPASSIRGYKNLYFDSVPKNLLNRLTYLKITSASKINKNTLLSFSREEQISKSLNYGRIKRRRKLYFFKKSIPKVSELIFQNKLNVLRWFDRYIFLLNSGFRKSTFYIEKNIIKIKYTNFAKSSIKEFEVMIPKEFTLDKDFIYFFGLWCGDRAGGKRFGICNKNKEIIKFTEKFLKRHNQKIERTLYISELLTNPEIEYDKKFVIKTDRRGWVLSIHSYNGILSSFFHYLYNNLDEFLSLIDPKPFFAGLFDAEGNVSLYNKSFRIACKNTDSINIYKKFLRKLNLYDKYDGNCLITYNLKDFVNLIVPYMKHTNKINLSNFLFTGKEPLPEDYKRILNFIKNNPKKTSKEIAKALNKNKLYSELKLLSDFHFVYPEGYPYRYEVVIN